MLETLASTIGSTAALQRTNGEQTGQVVATFPNSFYIRTARNDLVFVTNRPLRSQITINVGASENWARIVKPLELVCFRGNEIRVGESARLDLTSAKPWDEKPDLTIESIDSIRVSDKDLLLASNILMIVDNKLSVLDPSGISNQAAIDFVHEGVIPLRDSCGESRFNAVAEKIVGLGGGFTPSSDDMLGGFLATYNFLAKTIGRPRIILDLAMLETKTSWISAKLLNYLQQLVLDEQMLSLLRSTVSSETDSFVLHAETIVPRGHTSGIDLLVGAVLALSLVRDIKSRSRITERVAHLLELCKHPEVISAT